MNFQLERRESPARHLDKSILVDADIYLLQLVCYIHKNPLKAELVKRLDQYVWSSHKGYLSKAKKWNWLYKDFVLEMLKISASMPKSLAAS